METETALFWGFVVLLLLVLATITGLLVHAGLFVPVSIKTCKPDIGEIHIAYKFARGPYQESGALFTEAHTLLPEYRTIGVYYDDPKMKQPQKLRYIVGIILAENGTAVVSDHKKLLEDNDYHFTTFPSIDHAVQTYFPFNSTISIVMAVMKVYPALREYVETRSLCARPFIEVYDSSVAKIIFIGPLAQQDDFYVPEVQEEEDDDHQDDYQDDDRTENSSRSWDETASVTQGDEAEYAGAQAVLPPPPAAAEPRTPPLPSPAVVEEAARPLDAGETGSVGGEESDANTGSSFEEIDEKEAAAAETVGEPGQQDPNSRRDEDEVER